jgi:hypothetical protein
MKYLIFHSAREAILPVDPDIKDQIRRSPPAIGKITPEAQTELRRQGHKLNLQIRLIWAHIVASGSIATTWSEVNELLNLDRSIDSRNTNSCQARSIEGKKVVAEVLRIVCNDREPFRHTPG